MEPIPLCHLDEHDDPRCPACGDAFCDVRLCADCNRHALFESEFCGRCEQKPTIPAPPPFGALS